MPPRYAWILIGGYNEDFWMHSSSNETTYPVFDQCSEEQIRNIVNQMITIHYYPRYDERDKGNSIIGNLVRSGIWLYQKNTSFVCCHVMLKVMCVQIALSNIKYTGRISGSTLATYLLWPMTLFWTYKILLAYFVIHIVISTVFGIAEWHLDQKIWIQ